MSIFTKIRRRRMAMQMSCAEVGEVLQQYLDGELDAATTPLVDAHLEMCRRCGLEASIYSDVKDALADQGELPEDSVRRLREFGERIAHGEIPLDRDD
jgi:predicted anti-sigma-YlaC factor YlaD